ncbi:class I SAM-dependent methyltransferase [Parapedobacter sp. ISTM3]|uniref:class I SAM-dependent methyltransferase n=1 Tax=Parapedobacter sp. ISTM3 TaxID=2800130 RepID=UPI0019059B79|nr:class I SAM-dependent methyltransferase [Parapedobacter sp. ISTM3]MBK1439839.1 class I SAM-dependent methyltransferase [Parapedobacter sp. ISTM3]
MKAINGLRYLWHLYKQRKASPDSFINWLRFANPGMLNEGNIYCIEYATENLPSDNPIIEIGSFCGLSTNAISHYLRKANRANRLITCDKWHFEGTENQGSFLGSSDITHEQYRRFVKETYIRNVGFFSGKLPHTMECFSNDFFDLWDNCAAATDVMGRNIRLGGPISFAYIDGNHTYQFARDDFLNVDRHLETGGFILFDDSADYYTRFGVNRLVREIKKMDRYELIIKNPNYLFRKTNYF